MEKVKEFLKKIPDWVKAVVASAVIIAVAVVVNDVVQTAVHRNISEIEADDFSHVFQVDSVNEDNGELVLVGWVFKPNEDAVEDDFDIVLYDYNQDEFYRPKMKDVVREDVNNYFLCEYDYTNSGFVATINSRKLDIKNKNYEVLIQKKDSRKAFTTGVYISKGELMYVKPEDYEALDVVGTALEEIVNGGVLRVYNPDAGMYVYQYEGKLYWIADKGYEFEEDKSTYIQYQLWTTQVNNLPQHRLDNNWLWDNISFYFENKEIIEEIIDDYRVCVSHIPTEYSVEKILTGYNNGSWMWKQFLRPRYELS